MTGTERREKIIQMLTQSEVPIPGKTLAQPLAVSRQVIVQDMALLRAREHTITSTNLGYQLLKPETVSRGFKATHTDEQVADELNLIVDYGGAGEDGFIYH